MRPIPGQDVPPPPPPAAAVVADGLVKRYGGDRSAVVALDGLSAAFPRGRFTAIMGPSGSGKSTLLQCLSGLDAPDAGRVAIGARDVTRMPERARSDLRRDRLGFVFQELNLIPTLNVTENITISARLGGGAVDRRWMRELVGVLGLADRLDHRPAELSGGQRQRVAIARALLRRPDVVFADEPTGNLDSRTGAEVLGLLRRAVDEFGQTIVMVTHDPAAASWSDRVVFLRDGRIVGDLDAPTADTVLARLAALEGLT